MKEHIEILNRVVEGDQNAFYQLYELFSENVYNTALSYAQQTVDAEEITQDVFTSIFRNAYKFKANSSVGTWIYRIAVNTSLNHIKKKKRYSFLSFGDVEIARPDFDHPGVLLENKEDAKILFEAIYSLPDAQKTAFILSYVEELPRQQIADIMESSLKAVESLLQRAKKSLRNKLKKNFPNRRKKRK